MRALIEKNFQESVQVKQEALKANVDKIAMAAECVIASLANNGKVLFFGNGGSAADSQHFAAEFIGRFQKERRSLPAIALTTDTSILTALGNDYYFDIIFARQIAGLGCAGDVAFGISTSGNSANVIQGITQAKAMGLKAIVLTGGSGGKLAPLADISIVVPSEKTARIQEAHLCIAHTICELVENHFAG